MNFPTNRVLPENLDDEASHHRLAPPEYQTPEHHDQVLEAIRAGRVTYAPGWNKPPEHVETASSEENEYTPPLTLLGYVLAFIFAIASIAFSAGYWLNLY